MDTCIYDGKEICAYDVTNINGILNYELAVEWREAGRNGNLYCPECGNEVILKVKDPNKKVPHFSHKLNVSNCTLTNNYIRESEEHKKGKMILYHYFKEKHPKANIFLNKRFSNSRRCDLYIEFNNGDKLAVEFQRTNIQKYDWQERHDSYEKQNIKDLWILSGKEEYLKERQIELTYLEQVMLNESDKLAIYFDVNTLKVTIAKNMRYVDLYIKNNDIEKLCIKSYNLKDILITTKGIIECDFNEKYKHAIEQFNECCTKNSLDRQQYIKQQEEYKEKIIFEKKKKEVSIDYLPTKKFDEIKSKYSDVDFKIGTIIKHKIYGIGEIIHINNGIVTMRKSNGVEQNISFNVCMKGILVTIIN